jgi:uncharacterized protein YndB with AHSA1/START domain
MRPDASVEARVARRFRAAPERVYDAWLDPALLGRWLFGFATRDEEVVRLTTEPRVGGTFAFLVRRQGQLLDHVGEYLELDRPQRLAFTWGVRLADQAQADDSRVTIEIAPTPDGCELTLVHAMHPQWTDFVDQAVASWSTLLDALAMAVE